VKAPKGPERTEADWALGVLALAGERLLKLEEDMAEEGDAGIERLLGVPTKLRFAG
jgi:hypothetical protein